MPGHASAYQRLRRRISETTDREEQDRYLDEILDCQQRATIWDATQWGLDPDNWLLAERKELAARGGCDWPIERCATHQE